MSQGLVIDESLDVSEEMKAFSRLLRRNRMKITDQRLLVAEKIFRTHSHFTAEDVTDHLKGEDTNVSKATVYRILSILVESNLILEHDFGKSYKIYEHCIGHEHHDHLICVSCGKILEFRNDEIERMQDEVAKKRKFKVTHHSLNLFGYCQDCQTSSADE